MLPVLLLFHYCHFNTRELIELKLYIKNEPWRFLFNSLLTQLITRNTLFVQHPPELPLSAQAFLRLYFSAQNDRFLHDNVSSMWGSSTQVDSYLMKSWLHSSNAWVLEESDFIWAKGYCYGKMKGACMICRETRDCCFNERLKHVDRCWRNWLALTTCELRPTEWSALRAKHAYSRSSGPGPVKFSEWEHLLTVSRLSKLVRIG